jgi:hypothetical protein
MLVNGIAPTPIVTSPAARRPGEALVDDHHDRFRAGLVEQVLDDLVLDRQRLDEPGQELEPGPGGAGRNPCRLGIACLDPPGVPVRDAGQRHEARPGPDDRLAEAGPGHHRDVVPVPDERGADRPDRADVPVCRKRRQYHTLRHRFSSRMSRTAPPRGAALTSGRDGVDPGSVTDDSCENAHLPAGVVNRMA